MLFSIPLTDTRPISLVIEKGRYKDCTLNGRIESDSDKREVRIAIIDRRCVVNSEKIVVTSVKGHGVLDYKKSRLKTKHVRKGAAFLIQLEDQPVLAQLKDQ